MCTACDENAQRSPFAVYMYVVFMAEVTVDTKTGKTAVDGQICGGVAQGIGLALTEDFEDLKKHTSLAACGRHDIGVVAGAHPGARGQHPRRG